MKFKFRLIESVLREDIEAVRKMYPTISDPEFEYIVKRFDPTYKQGSNSVGKYGKWLLNLAKKKDFEVDGSEDQVDEFQYLLGQFEKKKSALPSKDIGQFKSVDELRAKMRQTDEPQLSPRQKERQMRKSYKNAEPIWQDDEWQVWYPQNWDAACTLGKGTKWCTADSRTAIFYVQYTNGIVDADYYEVFPINDLGVFIRDEEDLDEFARGLDFAYNNGSVEKTIAQIIDIAEDENYSAEDENYSLDWAVKDIQNIISQKYSKDCIVCIVQHSESPYIYFYNPHEVLPYSQCDYPLYIFINKRDESYKYQLWCGDTMNDYWRDDPDSEWSMANKDDFMVNYSDLAYNDRSFADFAEQILGVPPQNYLSVEPPWSYGGDEEVFRWSIQYFNDDGVVKEEERTTSEEGIEAYILKLKYDGWKILECKKNE